MYDYHTHHERCGHASGSIRDYIESAIAKGLREIGIADHSPIYHLGDTPHALPSTTMSQLELPNYVSEMTALRDEYAGIIDVKLGIESDYVPGWGEHYRSLWRSYNLDFVIGSVHFVGGKWSLFQHRLPQGYSTARAFTEYLDNVIGAARSGAYDILAHFDVIKTFGHVPEPLDAFDSHIRAAVEAVAGADMAMELNTSGWRKSIDEQYPWRFVLEHALRCGIPIVLGSDAHCPGDVGRDLDRALALLRDVGFRHVATYRNRQRTLVPIEQAVPQAARLR
jgi:histidinol-phosphatase (PHP family)